MLGVKRAGIAIIFGAVGFGAVDTIAHNHKKDSSPAAATVHFTDKNPVITSNENLDSEIKHTPQKYYGASMEERFTAKGAPEINYPIGPGTFVTQEK